MKRPILQPGQTIGIVGGGQLGRMTIREARRSGYRTVVFTDEPSGCPAGQLADLEINASYFDDEARERFVKEVDVVTVEFENIPSAFLRAVEPLAPVHPGRTALEICQNREREKTFLWKHGIPHAEFRVVTNAATLEQAAAELGGRCVLKTADFGYDGKGQQKLTGHEDFAAVWKNLSAPRGVVEQWVEFVMEISVVCARAQDGTFAAFPVCENIHRNHILDITIAPARISPELAAEATSLAQSIAEALAYTGTLAVEMFVTGSGKILVNELAPRPHNSGHHTIDACVTSQFQQQLRTVTGLHPGDTRQHTPAVMVNLLGDLWPAPEKHPDWTPVLEHPAAFLHLYGKRVAKPGRKMGHFTVLGETVEAALASAHGIRRAVGLES
jgi:5-(carboxyamino)imidazole ribonucleotide synthase